MPRGRIKDLQGLKFNRLTAISFAEVRQLRNGKRFAYWNCVCDCGTPKVVCGINLTHGQVKSCGCLGREKTAARSKEIFGPAHPAWKGGRAVDRNGYVWVWARGHPNANKQHRHPEHRLIMEAHLGRYLGKDESVHHKNGIKNDNRIENLELWSRYQPTGQRVQDLVSWAMEVLDKYQEVAVKLVETDILAGKYSTNNNVGAECTQKPQTVTRQETTQI